MPACRCCRSSVRQLQKLTVLLNILHFYELFDILLPLEHFVCAWRVHSDIVVIQWCLLNCWHNSWNADCSLIRQINEQQTGHENTQERCQAQKVSGAIVKVKTVARNSFVLNTYSVHATAQFSPIQFSPVQFSY